MSIVLKKGQKHTFACGQYISVTNMGSCHATFCIDGPHGCPEHHHLEVYSEDNYVPSGWPATVTNDGDSHIQVASD